MIPHRHLRAEAELPRPDSTGPDHDLVEYRGENATVNNLLKSDVLCARRKAGADDAAIRFKTLAQTVNIGFAADEAGFGVR